MTLRQELGFEIAESLLDEHNHKLKSTKKAVFDLIKREYYEAGSNIDTLVQRNCEKEVAEKVARIERKNIV